MYLNKKIQAGQNINVQSPFYSTWSDVMMKSLKIVADVKQGTI